MCMSRLISTSIKDYLPILFQIFPHQQLNLYMLDKAHPVKKYLQDRESDCVLGLYSAVLVLVKCCTFEGSVSLFYVAQAFDSSSASLSIFRSYTCCECAEYKGVDVPSCRVSG